MIVSELIGLAIPMIPDDRYPIHGLILLCYNVNNEAAYCAIQGARKVQEDIQVWVKDRSILIESDLYTRHLEITITLIA